MDNYGFYIEKSQDGELWENLSFIEGKGTTLDISNYIYIDKIPQKGINYYRLKQIHEDGKTTYSSIVNTHFDKEDTTPFTIFPNPTKDIMWINPPDENPMQIQLFNAQGTMVLAQTINKDSSLDLQHLPNGIYVLFLKNKKHLLCQQQQPYYREN